MHPDALGALLEDHNPWWSGSEARRAVPSVRRDLHGRLLKHVGNERERRALLILGPRQVGKTTLLLQLAEDLLKAGWPPGNLSYFSFDDDRLTELVSAREIVDFAPVGISPQQPRLFLLDEISRAVNWAAWLKQEVDRGHYRLIATDSAASLLRAAGAESGQGRWDEVVLEGLTFAEFLRLLAFPDESLQDLLRRIPNAVERYLQVGGFPEHARADDYRQARERLRVDVAERAIGRDLLRLGVDVEQVRRLFVYLVQDSGAIFSAAKCAKDLGADHRSVDKWVALLEDARLIARLPRHARRPAAQLRSKPRIYASDHGLISAFTPGASLLPGQRVRAQAVEAAVYRHLREWARDTGAEVTFFRQDDGLEADFVLELAGARTVIEVTGSLYADSEKVRRLRRAGEALKAGRLVMIHAGMLDQKPTTSVTSLRLSKFLLEPSLIWEAPK